MNTDYGTALQVARWYIFGASVGIVIFALISVFTDFIDLIGTPPPNPPEYPELVGTIVLYNTLLCPFAMIIMAGWLLIAKDTAASVTLFVYYLVSVTTCYVLYEAHVDIFIFLIFVLFLFLGVIGTFVYRSFVFTDTPRQNTPDAYHAYAERMHFARAETRGSRRPPPYYAQYEMPIPGQMRRPAYRPPRPLFVRHKEPYIPSIVLGVIAVVTCWAFGISSMALGIIGMALAIANRFTHSTAAGFIISAIGMILGVSVFMVMFFFFV